MSMRSVASWVLAHKKTVVVVWAAITLVGILASGPATDRLDSSFSVPNKEGWETNERIAEQYRGTGGDTVPLLPVVTLPEGMTVGSTGVRSELGRVDRRLRTAFPGARIASFASTGDRAFVSGDGRTTFGLIYPRAVTGFAASTAETANRVLDRVTVGGQPVRLTGFDALAYDSESGQDSHGLLAEALVGGLGALLVLVFVFASFLAVIPLFMAVIAIMTTFLLLLGLTEITPVSDIVQFLIALLGLGVAIDYSLLVVSRWREERSHGKSGDEAVLDAMDTAGRAVIFSGITVAIGLLALVALPLPFLRSLGYAGMLIPLVSTLVAITLLPVVLATIGPKLDWPHRRTDDEASRGWTRWAGMVTRRRG